MVQRLCVLTLLLAAFFVAGCVPSEAAEAPKDAGEASYANAEERLYVANQGEASISIIDMEENRLIHTVDLTEMGFSENAKPHHVVVEPDGSYWYVSLIGANTVLKLNRENEIVARADYEVPGMLALDPTSNRLFVGRSMSAVNPPHSIGIIDREAMTVEVVEVFFPRPHALAVTEDGAYAYSASLAQNQIAAIETGTQDVELMTLEGPTHTLVQFAVAPEGGTMVAGGQVSGQFFFFDTTTPATPTVTDTLAVGGQPWHPVYTPDGRYIYVGNKAANTVTVIDAADRTIETVIEGEGLAAPHGSAVRPDGRYIYISNNNMTMGPEMTMDAGSAAHRDEEAGTVAVIDTRTNEIVEVIEVGTYPTGIGAASFNLQ